MLEPGKEVVLPKSNIVDLNSRGICYECQIKCIDAILGKTPEKGHQIVKLFYGNSHYPMKGYEDFKGYYNDIESAKAFVEKELENACFVWAQIVIGDKIVCSGEINCYPKWEWKVPDE